MFVKILKKISILLEIFENLDFRRNFRKISIFSKFFENVDFGRNFW